MFGSLSSYLRKLAPVAVAAGVLGIGVVAIDLVLGRLFPDPERWERDIVYWDRVEEIGGRLAAYQDMVTRGEAEPGSTVAVLGSSSVWCGFDGKALAAHDPEHRTWLPLGAAGSRAHSLDEHNRALFSLKELPAQIVIGIHQIHFSGDPHERYFEPLPFGPRSTKGRILAKVKSHSFAYNYTRATPPPYKLLTYHLRLEIGRDLDIPLSHLHRPAGDPFAFPTDMAATPNTATAPYEQKPRFQDFLGSTDDENFTDASTRRQMDSFQNFVGGLLDRGCEVTVVLMPENRWFRPLFAGSEGVFWDRFSTEFLHEVDVIDLRDSMGEDDFYDPLHLNRAGAEKFSSLFPATLGQRLSKP